MDQISLEGMVFNGRHGVRPAEREKPQEFKVDVKVEADLKESGRSDRVEDTVDYRRIYKIAKSVIEGESANLIEALAQRIADQEAQLELLTKQRDELLLRRSAGVKRYELRIKPHMEVIGADGVHLGTVDRVEGGRIRLATADR